MPFEKGHNIGRPKGSSNKETKRIREWINAFLNDNTETLQNDIMAMQGKDRVNALLSLMEYAVPKLARTELVGDESNDFKLIVEVIDPNNG